MHLIKVGKPPSEDRLLRAIEAIYDAAPDPSSWPNALQAIADCFGDVGAILIWKKDDGQWGTIVSESLAKAQDVYVDDGWSLRDINAVRCTERGYMFNGAPFADRHLCSANEIENDPLYTEFARPLGLGWIGGVAVSPDPQMGVALSIQRDCRTKQQFSDEELEVVARIGRHIEKSLRLSIRLLDFELINVGLGEALTRIGIGVFALDSLGRVLFKNPAGQLLLGDQIDIVAGRLRIGSGSERRQLDAAILQTLRGERADLLADPMPILVQRPSSDCPILVYLLPVARPAKLVEEFLSQTRAIVLLIEPKIDAPADPAVVRDVFGLTLGEARVAALVASGLAPRDTAVKLGIAEETARSVLKRVFAKVGVSRQSELAALLAKLVMR